MQLVYRMNILKTKVAKFSVNIKLYFSDNLTVCNPSKISDLEGTLFNFPIVQKIFTLQIKHIHEMNPETHFPAFFAVIMEAYHLDSSDSFKIKVLDKNI